MSINDLFDERVRQGIVGSPGVSQGQYLGQNAQQVTSFEDSDILEAWGDRYSSTAAPHSYFDYYFSGQDMKIFIDGVEDEFPEIPITTFGFNVSQQKTPVYGLWSYCVDEETEALTQRGWLSGTEINETDTILSMDPKTQELKWSSIKSIYRDFDYSNKMHYITSKNIDALVTPGHKFALSDGSLKPIDEIRKKDRIVSMGTSLQNESTVYTDAFVELVGWFVTEGHIRSGDRSIEIAQSKTVNPDKCLRIEKCLEALGVKYSTYTKRTNGVTRYYIGTTNTIVPQLLEVASARVLSFPFMVALSTRQRELLINTMLDGDGWRSSKNGRQYAQKDMAHIDSFVALCGMSGISTRRTPGGSGCSVITLKNRKITEGYSVDFHGGWKSGRYNTQTNNSNPNRHKPTVDYKGLVWCPETEFGTFVCRRNDKVYVTGNTYDAVMRGTRVVSGTFTIATTSTGYMRNLLSKAASSRLSQDAYNFYSTRKLVEDGANIEKYWSRNIDTNIGESGKNIFSVHPPFNFVIVYGIQNTSVNKNSWTPGLQDRYENDAPMSMDINERIVEAYTYGPSMTYVIDAVELQALQVGYAPDGSVCSETYQFFARDLIIPATFD